MLSLPVLVSLLAAGQSSVTLHFEPPVGKVYRYKMTMKMTQSSPMSPKPITFQTDTDVDMKVLSRSGAVTTLETTAGKTKATVPADSPMAGMKSMLEKTLPAMRSQMDRQFKSVNVSGGAAGSSVMGAMQNLAIPSRPLHVGESWSTDVDFSKVMGGGGAVPGLTGKMPLKFKLESIKGGVARIDMTMVGSMPMTTQGQTMNIGMKGSGWIDLQIASGMTEGMTMTVDADVTSQVFSMKQHMVQTMVPR